MAELEGGVEIMPVTDGLAKTTQGDFGRYSLQISEYDAAGAKQQFAVAIPQAGAWPDVMLRAALLKKTTFESHPMPMIIHGVIYADRMGLDIMAGDVYLVQGRPAISNKAKIKMALATGQIESIETAIKELPEKPDILRDCVVKNDLECTVTLEVKGWKKPLVRRAKLSRWYKGKNPNWKDNPEHMLELNTVAHACEYIAPGGTDSDEAPPLSAKDDFARRQASMMEQMTPSRFGMGGNYMGSTLGGITGI